LELVAAAFTPSLEAAATELTLSVERVGSLRKGVEELMATVAIQQHQTRYLHNQLMEGMHRTGTGPYRVPRVAYDFWTETHTGMRANESALRYMERELEVQEEKRAGHQEEVSKLQAYIAMAGKATALLQAEISK